jgi:hypothetical protein
MDETCWNKFDSAIGFNCMSLSFDASGSMISLNSSSVPCQLRPLDALEVIEV